jgi:hypothetical protein
VYILRIWRLGDSAVQMRMCRNEFAFTLIPGVQDVCGGRAAQDAWVYETRESNAGDVTTAAEYAFKVPDGFCAGLQVRL